MFISLWSRLTDRQRDVAAGQVQPVEEGQAYLERVTTQLDQRGRGDRDWHAVALR